MPPRTMQVLGGPISDKAKYATAKRSDAGKPMIHWTEAEEKAANEYAESIIRGAIGTNEAARLLRMQFPDRTMAACQNRLGKLVKARRAANALRDS